MKTTQWTPQLQAEIVGRVAVGGVVRKISGKPFRSGRYTSTVSGTVDSPYNNGRVCFVLDDGSLIEVHRCIPKCTVDKS